MGLSGGDTGAVTLEEPPRMLVLVVLVEGCKGDTYKGDA